MKKTRIVLYSRVVVSCLAVALLMSLAACGDATTTSSATPGASGTSGTSEYEVKSGEGVTYFVGKSGSIEFEIILPESGRHDDWGKAAIVELYENDYRGAKDGYSSLLPYKIKACDAKNCGVEPRYNLPWSQWRKVKYEWNESRVMASIDGTVVSVGLKGGGFSSQMKLVYGDHGGPVLYGAKYRNIVVVGGVKQ